MGHCGKCGKSLPEILYQLRSGPITYQFDMVCHACLMAWLKIVDESSADLINDPPNANDLLIEFWGKPRFYGYSE